MNNKLTYLFLFLFLFFFQNLKANYFPDFDGDGFGDVWSVADPNPCSGCVTNNLDCDDADMNEVVCLELPDTVFTTAAGSFEIFFRSLILTAHIDSFDFNINGTGYAGSDLSWTGNADSVVVEVKYQNNVLAKDSFFVKYHDFVPAANCDPSVVMTGHSYIQSGVQLSHLVPTTPGLSYWGSQTAWTGDNHEAVGNWDWSEIIDVGSPYHDGTELNIQHYIDNVLGGVAPDYWVIEMDMNDIIANTSLETYTEIDDHINNVVYPDALSFVNALISTTPDAKIAYMITPPTAYPPIGDLTFRKRQFRTAHLAKSTFGSLPNVTVLPLNLELDPATEMGNDIIHPTSAGYAKLAKGVAGWLGYQESMRPACSNSCSPFLNPINVTDNSGTPSDNASCHNGDLTLEATANSGVAPITYQWSADPAANVTFVNASVPLTGANFDNMTDDPILATIKVVATDADGCKDSVETMITIAPELSFSILKIENSSAVPNDGVVCFGDSVEFTPDGLPNGMLTYNWSTSAATPTLKVAPPYTNSNTNYTVTITDEYGCSNQGLSGATGISEIVNNVTYKPACDPAAGPDSVLVNVIGGSAPYQFEVNNAPFGTQELPWVFATFLPPGNSITVEVMESNGCAGPDSTLIIPTHPGKLDATAMVTDATCDVLGSIDLTVTGGTPPYSYSWSNGSTSEDLAAVADGTYDVDITDAFGCTFSLSETVGLIVNKTWYEDADADGFGDPNSSMQVCDQPVGYVSDNTDNCPATFNPGQEDIDMDGVGDACDPNVCPNTLVIDPTMTIDPIMQAEVSVSTTGQVVVANGVTTEFKAGTFIDLLEEFEVELGGVLTVEIYNCALLLHEEEKKE